MMDYLQQLYTKIFGYGSAQNGAVNSAPTKIVAFGNVLLDRSTELTDSSADLLERFQLPLKSKGELPPETLASITTEVCQRFKYDSSPGGSALNTVRILKHLGTDATFFGAVGADKTAEELRSRLQESGVDARLQVIDDTPTGQCICLRYKNNEALYCNTGASVKFSVDYLRKSENDESQSFLRPIERKQIIYIEGFFMPQRDDVCQHIIRNYIRERRRLAINLSASYIVEENFCQIMNLCRVAFFIFGNIDEFKVLQEKMRVESMEELAQRLSNDNKEHKIIVITKGEGGVELMSNYVDEYSPPEQLTFQSFNATRVEEIVDTTGAGDAFAAAFLHCWLEKRSLSECIRIATDMAAKVVTQVGCNLPEPLS